MKVFRIEEKPHFISIGLHLKMLIRKFGVKRKDNFKYRILRRVNDHRLSLKLRIALLAGLFPLGVSQDLGNPTKKVSEYIEILT